ncbi:MAG TPA: transcription antitermination factor NusB [Candidatus Deferrimicrobium sp.]|nr:transcription antitermination factor NusB [Candidatus Deferrimicrobium sp.]
MTQPPSPRRLARELVLQALYAAETKETSPEDSLAEITKEHRLSDENSRFVRSLYSLAITHRNWADGRISELSEHWDIKRMAAIDRAILRMAMVELQFMPETPLRVVLNEAIELARKFSTADSPAFVNGILDSFVKKSEKVKEP